MKIFIKVEYDLSNLQPDQDFKIIDTKIEHYLDSIGAELIDRGTNLRTNIRDFQFELEVDDK